MTEIATRSGWGDSPCNNVPCVSTATTAYIANVQWTTACLDRGSVSIHEHFFLFFVFFFFGMSKCYRFPALGWLRCARHCGRQVYGVLHSRPIDTSFPARLDGSLNLMKFPGWVSRRLAPRSQMWQNDAGACHSSQRNLAQRSPISLYPWP